MHGMYNYIPETNHVSSVYSVAAVLYLQSRLHVMLFCMLNVLYFYIGTCRNMCEMPNVADFCSSLILCFPCMLLRYCLSDFEIFPVAPVIGGITFAFTFHIRWISITWYFYILKSFQFLSWSYFCLQKLQYLLTCMCHFIITDYDVRFIVRDGSVVLHLLVP